MKSRWSCLAVLFCLVVVPSCDSRLVAVASPDPLEKAILDGDFNAVQTIVLQDPELVNGLLFSDYTPLYYATLQQQQQIIDFLLRAGADPFMECQGIAIGSVDTAAALAVRMCRLDLAKRYVESAGQDFDLLDIVNLEDAVRDTTTCGDEVRRELEEWVRSLSDD